MFGFMIWCFSITLFDIAKFSWCNLIDILFISLVKQRSMCPEKRDIIEKQEHIFGKKTQFKIKLTCIILNLTILFSKFSYFARFQVNYCLMINLLIFAWHLKILSLKIVVFFFFISESFLRYIDSMQTTVWHKHCLHN